MKLNILDLNKLKYFQVVADFGSLLRASQELNLTTSAIYQSVKRLEEDLGVHLFYRSGKKYVLTEDGQKLRELILPFFRSLEEFLHETEEQSDISGVIKAGLPLNFSKTIFPPFVHEFRQTNPNAHFNLQIGETRESVQKVVDFKLDFAITDDDIPSEFEAKIAKSVIYEEELVLAAAKGLFTKVKESSLKDLLNTNHLSYSEECSLLKSWYKAQGLKKCTIKNFQVIDNVETLLTFIKLDLGIGVVPKKLIEKEIKQRELKVISFSERIVVNKLYLVQNLDYIPTKISRTFLEFIQSQLVRMPL